MFTELENWIINALQSVFDQFGWFGVAGMMVFENATGITPSEIVLGMAGWFLLSRHEMPFAYIFLGGLYAAIGSVIGASLTYGVARSGGRPVVDKVAKLFRVPNEHVRKVEELFNQWGPWLVLFGRMVPGIRTLVSIPAGLSRMPFGWFAVATFLGAYVWCTLLIGAGFWLGEEWNLVDGLLHKYAIPLAIVAVVLALLFLWYQRAGKGKLSHWIKQKRL